MTGDAAVGARVSSPVSFRRGERFRTALEGGIVRLRAERTQLPPTLSGANVKSPLPVPVEFFIELVAHTDHIDLDEARRSLAVPLQQIGYPTDADTVSVTDAVALALLLLDGETLRQQAEHLKVLKSLHDVLAPTFVRPEPTVVAGVPRSRISKDQPTPSQMPQRRYDAQQA